MKFRLCTILVLIVAGAAVGQTEYSTALELHGTQLIPTGAAFHHEVAVFRDQVENGDSNDAVEYIQYKLKVDFNTADDLLVLFLEAALAIEADSRTTISALACMDGDPYEILAQMYDVNEDVGLIHYERLKQRLDKVTAWKLVDWMSDSKESMSYSRMDAKAEYRRSGQDPSDALAQMCRGTSVGSSQ